MKTRGGEMNGGSVGIYEGEEHAKEVTGEQSGDRNFVEMKLERGTHQVFSEAELGGGATSTMPTRARSQKWTTTEAKWYAIRWFYDSKVRDKVGTGEYVLERPPKKPGGGGCFKNILFMFGIFMAVKCAPACAVQPVGEFDDYELLESSAGADDVDQSPEGRPWKLFGRAFLGVILLLFLIFRKKAGVIKTETTLRDGFDLELEKFLAQIQFD